VGFLAAGHSGQGEGGKGDGGDETAHLAIVRIFGQECERGLFLLFLATDRGTPVARIVALDAAPVLDRLAAQGIISRPGSAARPVAGGRARPEPKRPVADIVGEQRR
jgi:antitoxin (DNA-binding transcriptional repressor) of toxin-antitoxin stability system